MWSILRSELAGFVLGLLTSLAAGVLVGAPIVLPLLFACGYVIWLLVRMANIVLWLQSGAKPARAPPTVGAMNQVVELIHREKKYSRKQRNRFRRALNQFHSLAAELPDATVVIDELKQIRWSNNAALTLLNVHPERDRRQRIDNLIRDPEFHAFMAQTDPATEIEIPAPAGHNKTLAVRKIPSGKGMCVLIAIDVTQRVKIREMRKAFVGNVSHKLRIPLTVIQDHLEALLDDSRLEPSVRADLQIVSAQSDRLHHIVEHLPELPILEGNPLADNSSSRADPNKVKTPYDY